MSPVRRIDPTSRPATRPDGSPDRNDRVEIGPTPLAFAEWAAAGLKPPDLAAMRGWRLARLAAELSPKRDAVQTVVRTGRAPWEIVRVAGEVEADLIIITTHGYTGLKHVLMGSTAELIVRHAPCPVLTVRDPEHDFVERKPSA